MTNRLQPNSTPQPSLLHEHLGSEYVAPRFLGNLGRLELLRHEGQEVYIPRAVAEEIAEKPDAAAQAVQAACETRAIRKTGPLINDGRDT